MSQASKGCFVTVGATVSFDSLVAAIVSVDFLSSLANAEYTHLVVQYGKSGASKFNSCLKQVQSKLGKELPLTVEGFDLKLGIRDHIKAVVSGPGGGLLIAHAG
jgi:beta-1,4-N-acetylglucosaminyltransferase